MIDKTKTDIDDLREQMSVLGQDVAKLTELMKSLAATKADEARGKAAGLAGDVSRRAQNLAGQGAAAAQHELDVIERRIVEKPLQSATIALFAGLLIGMLTRR